MSWEIGADLCALQCPNGYPVGTCYHSPGSSAQGSVMTERGGWKGGRVCVHIAGSLHCIAETGTKL